MFNHIRLVDWLSRFFVDVRFVSSAPSLFFEKPVMSASLFIRRFVLADH